MYHENYQKVRKKLLQRQSPFKSNHVLHLLQICSNPQFHNTQKYIEKIKTNNEKTYTTKERHICISYRTTHQP